MMIEFSEVVAQSLQITFFVALMMIADFRKVKAINLAAGLAIGGLLMALGW